jgi:NitT/TauT family transport system permease protein
MSPRRDALLLVAATLILWHAAALLAGPDGLATPIITFREIEVLLTDSSFWYNAAATLWAFLLAAFISACGGVLAGLLLGLHRLSGEVAEPILNTVYAIPKITLYPVVLLLFGLGLSAKVAFGVLHGIFPVVLLTMNGVRGIAPVHLRTARALHLSSSQLLLRIILPASLPEVFSGLRIGMALALLGTLVGEFFTSDRGIGFLLTQSISRNDIPGITAITALLFALASLGGLGLLALDRRLHHRPNSLTETA